MLFKSIVSLALVAAAAAQATKGKAFDHVFIVFLENTNYQIAATDPILSSLTPQGVLLDNYSGVTHPSEPNYVAAAGGDYFGISDDSLYYIPSNVTTIVDLLDKKGLTWKTYQEDLPHACFTGFNSTNLYMRKHNPFIIYDSIAQNQTRCNNVVPATQLATDLAAGDLPNYSFYTPNMLNDAHDTTIAYASKWLNNTIIPLLSNPAFNNNTLVVITFDETEDYPIANRVWTLLLGDAVAALKNTTDSTYYTHYSLLSTVESNWDLGNLGRQDTNVTLSNVFDFVAKVTGYENANVTNPPFLNDTIPGFMTNHSTPLNTTSSTPKSAADSIAVPKVMAAFAVLAGAFAAMI
ncbi:hypothetical protein BGZ80_003099 [Entomortierella chlamydospora]|uniref:Acid phosphatase n=1 Tax=Entomortierella chlamydospora TaxID=101097 RepID=A0A9P6N0V2_9FUNG|nr:hypothetical protein BGZ79_000894 [Entomortierella chlamydospora]KAG0021062.1 hypothetical protein BGZ80_003099 [Entomortierella chlamydospora]